MCDVITMNKKLIGAILCIGLLMMSAIPIISAEDPSTEAITVRPLNFTERELKKVDKKMDIPVTAVYGLCTVGAKKSVKIQLLDGNASQMDNISKIIDRKPIRSWLGLPARIQVTLLNFTVTYEKDAKRRSRLAYFTEYGNANFDANGFTNLTGVDDNKNVAHAIQVTNFTGYFVSLRARLFRMFPLFQHHRLFTPAEFMFVGFCDSIAEI